LRQPDAATWLMRLQPKLNNFQLALQWALDERCNTEAAWLLVLWWFVSPY
jgi:hypothetical protein